MLLRVFVILLFITFLFVFLWVTLTTYHKDILVKDTKNIQTDENIPLSIIEMRNKKYPGSEIKIEEELPSGNNYKQYVVSFYSDKLKQFALLTIPTTEKPQDGFPVIIFNHGYIPPKEYKTTERYAIYVDSFARNGYIVLKPDYRGHGNSQGEAVSAYFSPSYTIDVLNALSSVKKLNYADKNKIGMWGHSMGGNITQRVLVINSDIKAAVIWGGVVGSYEDIFRNWWNKRPRPTPQITSGQMNANRNLRQNFINIYQDPSKGNPFWDKISPTTYLKYQSAPVQLHHGLSDETVPYELSRNYKNKLINAGKSVELFEYEGNDHNISQSFNLAMQRSIDFFDKYLKNVR